MVAVPNRATLDDPACFDAFFETALPRVYSYLLARSGGEPAVAEDLTQETFLAAVHEIQRGRNPDKPLPWVMGIAQHKLFDYYRATAKHQPHTMTWDDDRIEALPDIPELDPPERERIQRVLMQVPITQRQALVLRYMDGYAMPEIAQELDRSVHATESLLARGRANFRSAYREEEHHG
ncbi:MAG: RNA polymerase sigma factor [Thermomicrobiales bacterium]